MDTEELQEARSYVERQLHIFYWHRILELFNIVALIVDAKWLEEKTTEIGEAAGKLIASNPESKQAFQNGNVAKRLQMIVQVMWQKK